MQDLIQPIDLACGEEVGVARERFFRQLVDCSLDIITVLDERGFIRFGNPATEQLLGYQPDELIGRLVFDFIHPDDHPAALRAFQGVLARPGQTASAEFRFQIKSGSWRYLAAVGKNLLHEPGIAGVIVNSRDVTEQKQAERALRESEQRFRQLTENIDEVFWISDPSITRMYYISPAYEKIWGRTCESVMESPRSFLDAVHPDDRDELLANLASNEVGRPYSTEYRIIRPDGAVRWISDRGFPVFDQHGAVYRCAGIAEDITAKVRDQEQLRLQSSALSAAANSIFITDKQGRIMWANTAFCRLSGFRMEELIDQTPRVLKSGKHDVEFYKQIWQTILTGKVWSGEIVERRKNGELFTVHQMITPLTDGSGEITHFIAVHEDITARKDTEARIERMAYHDSLTGLCNRVELQNRLEHAVQQAKRHSRSLALHFIDLDRFKVINDTQGHSVGDALLQAVARRLEGCLRASDTAARIGGDEFAVLQPEIANPEGAATLAGRIISAIAEPFRLAGRDVYISPSIGISVCPLDSNSPDELLRNADMAMYQAKNQGRNNFQFFTSALNAQIRDRLLLESDLHAALGKGELVLHYQPQVNLRTRCLTGMEALIRWNHPTRGMVLPSLFIGVAEECGLIHGLSRWVLEQACAQNVAWQAAGLPCRRIAVNISSANFKHGDLCQIIADVLERTQLPSKFLELEVTETLMLQDEHVVKAIPLLKKMGVTLSIDDFGTGYSSLTYLRRLPVEKLKIDQSFVRGLPESQDDAIIARAIIDLGHALGHTIIAEGVESEEQLVYLRDHGCDEGQGYLFGRPMPAKAFEALLERENDLRCVEVAIS
jgi:diguanylate cyclase (GGDEF)-like protein/PAS domain S-box-containing protein